MFCPLNRRRQDQQRPSLGCNATQSHTLRPVPKHSGAPLHGREDWEESQLASGHCANGAPFGLSQDCMADLEARPRERAAGEHQLVHEMAALEDSCVDASVVLQDPKFVPRAFWLCRCFEEPGRCPPSGEELGGRWNDQGLYLSLSTVGCLEVVSTLPEPLWVHTLTYPDLRIHLNPLLKKMKIKTTTSRSHPRNS